MSGFPMQDPTQSPAQAPAQAAPQTPPPNPVSPIQQQLQQISQTPMQPVPPVGPDQGTPVRRFLTNFFYGMGQGALKEAGLPTDYQKQQQVIANNQRQQQLNQQAGETSTLIGMHQQATADAQRKAQQDQADAVPTPGGKIAEMLGIDPTTVAPAGFWRDALYKHITTPPHERAPLSTSQGYYNVGPDGKATPIVGPDNQPLMPGTQAKPDTPEQQYLDEYQKTHPGASIAQALRGYTNDTQKITQPTPITLVVPQADGSGRVMTARSGETIAPNAQSPTEFSKRSSTFDKLTGPLDAAVSSADDAHRYAEMNNGTGDAALVLRYADAIKPDKGFRLTNTELNLFMHSRSLYGNGEALLAKVQSGALLTPQQRQDMLGIIDMKAGHARQMRDSLAKQYGQYAGQDVGGQGVPAPANNAADPFAAFGGKKR